ncbi:MAG TPA: MFS transporter [Streptosporangiaceae bacterium]|nr:MFS transporter [Streptosporangiaceae bacterium]
MSEPADGGVVAGQGNGAAAAGGSTSEQRSGRPGRDGQGGHSDRYKWLALSNTTIGMLAATVNASIVIISLPAIFRGIKLNPLTPGNVSYLLWMLMGYLVVSAVLVVTLGRLGDIYGRVKMYNAGFAIFGLGALALPFDPFTGGPGALWLIGFRVVQAVGGAMLMATAPAILTDAFPANQRGTAMGINQVAGISGMFIGLILGGILAAVDWRLVFIVSVPIGIGGAIWSYLSLREIGIRTQSRIDWIGNVTFAIGLIALLTGITYGIQPYGGHNMGWSSPLVLTGLIGGAALLVAFCIIELRVESPMFDLRLMKIRAFAAGVSATLLASIARGGLQFMLIIWLQGIWLPLHGYAFKDTPLWSGIYLLALTGGFVVSGPVSGWLSDKHGARAFASGGLLVSALAFGGLLLIPTNFSYSVFAVLIFVAGAGMGLFSAPNAAAIMNSVPARQRGAASGMLATFQNSGFVLSIGIFFSLMIAGLASSLPTTLTRGLTAQGVPSAIAHQVGSLPPVGSLFAAFLGYNPIQELLKPTGALARIPPANAARLTGKSFFPQLISQPFHHGLVIVFIMAMAVLVIAAGTSLLRGGRYVHDEHAAAATVAAGTATEGAGTDAVADEVAAEAADDANRAAANGGAAVDGDGRRAVRAGEGRANPDA